MSLNDKHNWDTYLVGARVRRLTPRECERLQAFPDDWTKVGVFDGVVKQVSDSQRYKTLGNSVTTSVVQAVMEGVLKCQTL